MKSSNILILVMLISPILLIPTIFALTANSSSYSVNMFGTSIAASNASSTSYNSTSALSEAKGTTRNAESSSYTANVGFFSNTVYYRTVSISSYSISPRSATIGSTIGLSISALNYQATWAKITAPNGQEQILTLVNNVVINYLPIPSIIGRYNVTFYANSSTGAISSAIDYFELTAQTPTPTPAPSGGGGGGGASTCTYIWDCTPWSICLEGKHKRECKNIGTCSGTEGKPKEEMTCSEALFDISINLKEIEISKNRTLAFTVDLIETKSQQKIDVYLKYSIINSNNTEIFSQTETRALFNNMSYKKEIKEMKLADGDYILRTDVFYGYLQRAFAEQKFRVGGIPTEAKPTEIEVFKKGKLGFWLFIILLIIILILLIIIIRKKIKNICKKAKEKFAKAKVITKEAVSIKKEMPKIFLKREETRTHENINSLSNKKVYTTEGYKIGKVDEIYFEDKKSKIYGILVRLDRKIAKKVGKKKILVKYEKIKSIKSIVMIDQKVLDYLESYKS